MEELFLISCSEGSFTTCSKMIRKSINVNSVDSNGLTGLMKACQNNHYEVAKLLIQSGANVNQVDRYGQNALHYACKAKNEKIVKLLCNQENMNTSQRTIISGLTPKDCCLTAGNTKLDPKQEDEVEPVLYDILLQYETRGIIPDLSDIESDEEKTGGEVYKKEKKKKKGGKKGGKKKKGGKGKKKKKK